MFLTFVLTVSACGWSITDPALAHYTPVPPTATPDPLHYPVLQPTVKAAQTETVIQLPPPDSEIQSRSLTNGNGIRCDVNNDGVCNNADVRVLNADIRATQNAALPSATARPITATATARPSATATKPPTPTLAPQATATHAMPTANPSACKNCVTVIEQAPQPVPNIRGLTCPTWAHDYWLVQMPNGRHYRTWHPAVQPNDLPGAGCVYDHSHGSKVDPRLSKADPTLPAYGYAADLHGMSEPHVGFKTFFANAGERNEFENFSSTSDVKATFHQGTLGAGRVAQRMHSFEFDLLNTNGAVVHVDGMGDTGFVYNQCDPAASINNENGTIGVRLMAMPKPLADSCNVGTPYEVWEFVMPLDGDNRIHAKLGAFDAITVLNPSSGLLEPTSATWPNAPFNGCKFDAYYGPIYLNTNIDMVDAHGLRQIIKRGNVNNFPMDSVGKSAFKLDYDGCGAFDYTNN